MRIILLFAILLVAAMSAEAQSNSKSVTITAILLPAPEGQIYEYTSAGENITENITWLEPIAGADDPVIGDKFAAGDFAVIRQNNKLVVRANNSLNNKLVVLANNSLNNKLVVLANNSLNNKLVVLANNSLRVGYFRQEPDRVVVTGIVVKYPDGKVKMMAFQEVLPVEFRSIG